MGSEKSNEVIANMLLKNLRKDREDQYRSVIVNIVFTPLFVNRSDMSQFELSWADAVNYAALQFITLARLGAIAGAINFNNKELIPSSPVATFDGSDLMISKTS